MKKLDNKGLSLVELLIAIAVMALLLSPIMLQLIQSVQLSGEAKERQYVIDNANEIIEYVRKYDKKELELALATPTDLEGIVRISSVYDSAKVREKNPSDSSLPSTVYLYLADGTNVGYVPGSDWDYIKYYLDDAKLGKDNQEYGRYVVQSNLVYEIGERGYEINYDLVNGSGGLATSLSGAGFEFRSDNSVVLCSGSDKYDDSKITGIVVKEKKALIAGDYNALMNPNETSIGDIQDIDADKMAIIPGDATSLDYQVESDMKTAIITYVKKDAVTPGGISPDGQCFLVTDPYYADNPQHLNDYVVELLSNPANISKTRNIHVTVTAGHDTSGPLLKADGSPKYYQVRCDVIYRAEFTATGVSGLKLYNDYTSNVGTFKYTVLNRKYYTDVPPNIYMIYEPLITQTATGPSSEVNVSYAEDEYITISTDKFTSGFDGDLDGDGKPDIPEKVYKNPSKLYLIRSTDNWQKVTGKSAYDDGTGAYYTTTYSGATKLVNIMISQAKIGATNSDNLYTDENQLPIEVYTNISVNQTHKTDLSLYSGSSHQFGTSHVAYCPGWKTDAVTSTALENSSTKKTARADQNNRNYQGAAASNGSATDPVDVYRYQYIKSVYNEEASPDGRLYKVTVVYTNKSTNEETYITGAKGAN